MNDITNPSISEAAITAGTSRKRAVIYLRVSTAKQASRAEDPDGYSLPAQRDACLRKADDLGADVVDTYIDKGESAKTANRPQFQAMLSRIRTSRDVDYVILDKVDRFARNRRDDANILFELRSLGCQLVSVKENIDETPAGELLHAIMAGFAEYYSKNLGAESIKGMRQKAKSGGTPGRAPIGYLNDRVKIDGREVRIVVVDPERAPHIQWAFEAYATGEYTLSTLADALEARGLTTVEIGKRLPAPLDRSRVARMLTNRYYMGRVSFQGTEYEGRHQPLVDEVLFERVQAVLRSHANGEKQRIHNHYLKSSVSCGRCGSRLCLMQARGKYLYFFCLGRHQKRTTCTMRYLAAEAVEAAVERYYVTVKLTSELQAAVRTRLHEELDRQRTQAEPEIATARKRVTELEQERRRLARGTVDGSIPGDLAREEHDRIETELRQRQAVLATAETVAEHIDETLTKALSLVGRMDEVYRLGGPRIRRLSNQAFFEQLFISDDEDSAVVTAATLNEPWASLVAADFAISEARETTNPDPDDLGRGSKMTSLVAGTGFEPVTSGL